MTYDDLKQGLKQAFTKENFKEALRDNGIKIVCAFSAAAITASAAVRLYDYEKKGYEAWKASQPNVEQVTPTKP
jgi:hypothetical protein